MVWVCFEEDALQWHISLDDEVRQDWTQLEKALIQRFPPPENRESRFLTRCVTVYVSFNTLMIASNRKTTPSAAAAALVPIARTGRLRMLKSDGTFEGYVSKDLYSGVYLVATTSVGEALVVQWESNSHQFRAQVSFLLGKIQFVHSFVTRIWPEVGICLALAGRLVVQRQVLHPSKRQGLRFECLAKSRTSFQHQYPTRCHG
jgi:hypothetical protein